MPVQFLTKYKKTLAIEMRSKGSSYSEIKKELSVPKSTLSFWLKNLKLTPGQKKTLEERQREAVQAGAKKRILKFSESLEEIKRSAPKDVKKISQRELWLLGIMLYWRTRFVSEDESGLKKGVRFMSSDPLLIKFFLKWLGQVGKIKNEEIAFDIFVGEDKKYKMDAVASHWSKVTGFPKSFFSRTYFLARPSYRRKNKNNKRRTVTKKASFGFLRIRVRASSLLARQIAGWMEGIKETVF